jgi:hypothetical protein
LHRCRFLYEDDEPMLSEEEEGAIMQEVMGAERISVTLP